FGYPRAAHRCHVLVCCPEHWLQPALSPHHRQAGSKNPHLGQRDHRLLNGSRANSPRLSLGTRPRTTLFAIGIASTAPSSPAVCVPWASGTSPSHRLRLGRMASLNACSDPSRATVSIIYSSDPQPIS